MTTHLTKLPVSLDEADDLSYKDYWKIFWAAKIGHGDKVLTYREFRDSIIAKMQDHPVLSIAYWSRYAKGEAPLSREARNELRALVDKPSVPPSADEIIHKEATVSMTAYQYTNDGTTVLLPQQQEMPIKVRVTYAGKAPPAAVTGRTSIERRSRRKTIHVSPEVKQKLDTRRHELAADELEMDWNQFMLWLLKQEWRQ